MTFSNTRTLFSIRGIEIRAHLSWLLIVALVGWSFWGRFVVLYERGSIAALIMAVVATGFFFGSVLLHELAHALEAQRRGVTVDGITLFVFGGATESRFDVKRPIDEFALTAAGPAMSFATAAVFWLGSVVAANLNLAPVAETLGSLGWINLVLALFNLLPGAPLDGGRILRSVAWWRTGDRQRSIVIASEAGRFLAFGLFALAAVQLLWFGGLVAALWTGFIALFLYQAARAEREHVETERLLAGRDVGWFFEQGEQQPAVPADLSVAESIDRYALRHDANLFPVRSDGQIIGTIDLEQLRSVQPGQRPVVTVGSVARPLDGYERVDRHVPASEALDTLLSGGRLLVTDGARTLGVLTSWRVRRAVERLRLLEAAGSRSPSASSS